MSKIARKTLNIFANGASNNGQFGSAQAGTKVLSSDPAVLQALPAWAQGWLDATISSENLPTLEEMQGIQYIVTYELAYLFQEGIPEYDAGTTYFIDSIVKKSGTVQLYKSLIDNNTGNALTNGSDWQFLVDLGNVESNIVWGATAGGTAGAITLTPATALTAYGTPTLVFFIPAANSVAGGTTINISGLGAKNITKGGAASAIAANDLEAGKIAFLIYDGTEFQLINNPPFSHGSDVAVASTLVLNGTGGDIINITGTSGAISAVTLNEGHLKICKFASAGATISPGGSLVGNTNGASYTFAAGDVAMFYGLASGLVVFTVWPANGQAPVPTTLPTYAANTAVANATTSTAAPTGIALATNTLLGRASGNIQALTLAGNISIIAGALTGTQKLKKQDITSSGSFTTSANITTSTPFNFQLVAGGAGGSGCASANNAAGGGAGETVFWEGVTGLSPSTSYTVTIGSGGNGGASGTNAGSAGTLTSIVINTDTVTANPGSAAVGFASGLGGTGSHSAPSVGTLKAIAGGGGGNGAPANVSQGANPGAASSFGGGARGAYQAAGENSSAWGSGGAGAAGNSASGAFAGGNGAPGVIVATWAE